MGIGMTWNCGWPSVLEPIFEFTWGPEWEVRGSVESRPVEWGVDWEVNCTPIDLPLEYGIEYTVEWGVEWGIEFGLEMEV